LKKKTKRG